MAAKPKPAPADGRKVVAVNKQARRRFEVLETFQCGLVLRGTEVKSLREGKITLDEAYGRIHEGVPYLVGCHIPEYRHGNVHNHEPLRRRTLLLQHREIKRLQTLLHQKGLTLVPLAIYFTPRGIAKIDMGVCKGKKLHDKRQDIRAREAKREMRTRE